MARRSRCHQASAGLNPAQGSLVGTYQTRIYDYAGVDRAAGDAALSAYASLYGQMQRKLFAEVAAGSSAASLKSAYLQRHWIPARLFNAVRVLLEGKVASVRESQRLQQDSLPRADAIKLMARRLSTATIFGWSFSKMLRIWWRKSWSRRWA